MRFLHPPILYLLIPLIGIFIFSLFVIRRQRKALKTFGDTNLVRDLMPDLSMKRRLTKDLLLILAMGLFIVALARPQMGAEKESIKKEGIEMMVCLDISNSMLSEDIKPSRLQRAKQIVSRMMDKLENNKIGLIFFAGDAFIQVPITSDLVSVRMFLANASPSLVSNQGTALGSAIDLATMSLSTENKTKKAIVIITDAENHDDDVQGAIAKAKEKGIIVDIVGVGSLEGAPIPIDNGSYLQDNEGNMVITKLNETIAKEIAVAGNGVYIHANDVSKTVQLLEKHLNELDKSLLETTVYKSYREWYMIPLLLGLILLAIETIYLDRKNRYLRKVRLFKMKEEDENDK